MARTALLIETGSLLGTLSAPTLAQDSRWGSADEPTVKFMIASEAKWTNAACTAQPDLHVFIADDYLGTSTTGRRYPKAGAIADDPNRQNRGSRRT
jgi:hypothetical protein